jgi:hypothetical protein
MRWSHGAQALDSAQPMPTPALESRRVAIHAATWRHSVADDRADPSQRKSADGDAGEDYRARAN